MESFLVAARRYRPQNFESVVGQDAVVQALKYALSQNQLGQAYLFCGPRGVGKTSCARIFAKAIVEKSLGENSDLGFNIFELDAASNNSVDDIRQLIEQVRIQPQKGKHKIYIIDEVHMLSQSAFNAFLKTLEEPPKHAIFILATTEKHKIIPTILSRCQVFDFKRMSLQDMVTHLRRITIEQSRTVEEEVLYLIANKADGGMRDALSIYDQLLGACSGELTYQNALKNLHLLEGEYYLKLSDAFQKQDSTAVLLFFAQLLDRGFGVEDFLSGLTQHFRDLFVAKNKNTQMLLEMSPELKNQYQQQAVLWSNEWILLALEELEQTHIQCKQAKNQRLLAEICLLKLSYLSEQIKKKS